VHGVRLFHEDKGEIGSRRMPYREMVMIVTKDKFLDNDTAEHLKSIIAEYDGWDGSGHPFWANRVIWFSKLSKRDAQLINIIRNRIAAVIFEDFTGLDFATGTIVNRNHVPPAVS